MLNEMKLPFFTKSPFCPLTKYIFPAISVKKASKETRGTFILHDVYIFFGLHP